MSDLSKCPVCGAARSSVIVRTAYYTCGGNDSGKGHCPNAPAIALALRQRVQALEAALMELGSAAEVYAADQSRATDQRCGLVQPVTVAEANELNAAILEARRVLEGNTDGC